MCVQLFRDREGSFWATTKAGDVYRFEPHTPVFRSYRHQPGNPHSLNNDSVISAYAEDRNTLWIGTDRGLNRVDRRTGQVTRYEEPVFSRGVRAIAKDRRGDLWFGTRGNGLVRFDPRSGRYRIYSHMASDPRTLSYDNIGALWIDRGGTLWVATDFGLNRFDRGDGGVPEVCARAKEPDPVSLGCGRTGRCVVAGNFSPWSAPFRSTHGPVYDV